MILTRELIQACKTNKGGFTNATIAALGLTWPLVRGWTFDLIGKSISDADYQVAIEGRFQRKTKGGNIRDTRTDSISEPEPSTAPEPAQNVHDEILGELQAIRMLLECMNDRERNR